MRALTEIRREIVARWDEICDRARTRPEARTALPKSPTLLGTGTKTEKGAAKGIVTAIVYMAPATEAFPDGDGRTLCAFATTGPGGCEAACLGSKAGRMVFGGIKLARLWKATLFLGARDLWFELLRAEIASFERSAVKAGFRPAVRIDGATDTGAGSKLAPEFPEVAFYDYTKVPHRARAHAQGRFAPNYHVTFSYSGENMADSLDVLASGGSVAVVTSASPGEGFPEGTLWGSPTVNGDEHDARFLDPTGGYVVLLSFKQSKNRNAALQRALRRGFVVHTDEIDSALAA